MAEVLSAKFPDAQGVNIACSGGVAKNLYRSSNGGEGQNGEPAQGDLLATVAKEKDVKLIIVSVGGNDLGFASIIAACLQAYESRSGPVQPQPAGEGRAEAADRDRRGGEVLRRDPRGHGRRRLQPRASTGWSPRPTRRWSQASETRYAENDPQRTSAGCPFYDADLDWARTKAGPEIGGAVKTAAASRGIETLELIDLLAGHEICAKTDRQVTPTNPPSATGSEWGRLLGGTTVQQGDLQEAFHPNAFAQARSAPACARSTPPRRARSTAPPARARRPAPRRSRAPARPRRPRASRPRAGARSSCRCAARRPAGTARPATRST